MYESIFSTFIILFAISFAICALVVLTRSFHLHHTTRVDDHSAVQSAHRIPTPRVGGVGVVIATMIGFAFLVPEQSLMLPLAVSILPVFAAGLSEDLGFRVSPRGRLLASAVSSLVAVYLLGFWIVETGVVGLDSLLVFAPFAICVTVLWTAGMCHSFNLIDGVNGMSGVTAITVALGLAAIAYRAGDIEMSMVALMFVPCVLGFLVLNWPFGKLFLGDAGAYSIGHVLAWLGILISMRSPQVAGISAALVFFWPVADAVFAIWRRTSRGKRADQPDRLHVHQLIMRGLEILVLDRSRRNVSNPMTTVILAPFIAIPVVIAVILWDKPNQALLASVLLGAAFSWAYKLSFRAIKKYPRRRGQSYGRGSPGPTKGRRKIETVIKSPYCGVFIEDGQAADVQIFRSAGTKHWQMEVVYGNGAPICWQDTFATDREAWDTFTAAVNANTIENLVGSMRHATIKS